MVKIVVLIISSDDQPFYAPLRDQWKRYMNKDPDIRSYFLRNDPSRFVSDEDRPLLCKLEGEYLYFQAPEIPIPGIHEKTVKSIMFLSQILPDWKDVDYIIRTNLSSFYIWDRLKTYLLDKPTTNFVAGDINTHHEPHYPSGCGVIMSKDVAMRFLLYLHHPLARQVDDDRMMGWIFHEQGITMISSPRYNVRPARDDMNQVFEQYVIDDIPSTAYHIRTRCGDDMFRLKIGPNIYQKLVDHFYEIVV